MVSIYTGKLLSALLSCFNDRSPGVRKAAATSVGHLVKVDLTNDKQIPV